MARRQNDKYLRLTGLWPSKNNDALWTGKLRIEDVEKLKEKVKEALDNEAPIVFSLWANDKKKSRKDPEYSIQCFVGDSEEQPRKKYSRDEEEGEETPRKKRKPVEEEEEEDEPAPKKKKKAVEEEEEPETPRGKKTKKSDDW